MIPNKKYIESYISHTLILLQNCNNFKMFLQKNSKKPKKSTNIGLLYTFYLRFSLFLFAFFFNIFTIIQ